MVIIIFFTVSKLPIILPLFISLFCHLFWIWPWKWLNGDINGLNNRPINGYFESPLSLTTPHGLLPVALDQSWSPFYFPILLIYQCSLCAPCRPISSYKNPASGLVKDRQLWPHSLFLHLVYAFLNQPTTSEPTVLLLVLLLALSSLPCQHSACSAARSHLTSINILLHQPMPC